MVLHEYYFGNMTKGGSGDPGKQSAFFKAAETGFGSYDIWKADFGSIGKMRGVGWAICFQDPKRRRLSNHWVSLHEIGNVYRSVTCKKLLSIAGPPRTRMLSDGEMLEAMITPMDLSRLN